MATQQLSHYADLGWPQSRRLPLSPRAERNVGYTEVIETRPGL